MKRIANFTSFVYSSIPDHMCKCKTYENILLTQIHHQNHFTYDVMLELFLTLLKYLNFVTLQDTPLQEGGVLLERYNVSELTKRIGDADLLKAKMREELMVSFTETIAKFETTKD